MKLSLVSLWAVTATLTAAAPTPTTSNHSHSDSSIEKRGPACNIIPGAWRGMDMNSLAVCNLQFAQTGDEEVVVPKNGYTVCTGGTGSFWVHSLGDGELRTARREISRAASRIQEECGTDDGWVKGSDFVADGIELVIS